MGENRLTASAQTVVDAGYCVHALRHDGTLHAEPVRVSNLRDAAVAIGMQVLPWDRGCGSSLRVWVTRAKLGHAVVKAHRSEDACPRTWLCSSTVELRALLNGTVPKHFRRGAPTGGVA